MAKNPKNEPLLYGMIGLLLGGMLVWLLMTSKSQPQPPVGMDDMSGTMSEMTSTLAGKTGAELEQAFLDEMIIHHQGAIDMAQMVKIGSNRPELRQLAEDIIAAQTKEIEMMRQWLSQWF